VNTIGRSDNIKDLLAKNVGWGNDSFRFFFWNSMSDIEGETTAEKLSNCLQTLTSHKSVLSWALQYMLGVNTHLIMEILIFSMFVGRMHWVLYGFKCPAGINTVIMRNYWFFIKILVPTIILSPKRIWPLKIVNLDAQEQWRW
jgi:hypothetical protein